MAENIFSSFDISGSGMSLQRRRLSAVANNIANANTTRGADGKPYEREIVVVRAEKQTKFQKELTDEIALRGTGDGHIGNAHGLPGTEKNTVLKAVSARDNSGPRMIHDPSHPDANEEGYVAMPNVNVVTEMVEMISAQRAFEANTSVIAAAKNVARDSLDI